MEIEEDEINPENEDDDYDFIEKKYQFRIQLFIK